MHTGYYLGPLHSIASQHGIAQHLGRPRDANRAASHRFTVLSAVSHRCIVPTRNVRACQASSRRRSAASTPSPRSAQTSSTRPSGACARRRRRSRAQLHRDRAPACKCDRMIRLARDRDGAHERFVLLSSERLELGRRRWRRSTRQAASGHRALAHQLNSLLLLLRSQQLESRYRAVQIARLRRHGRCNADECDAATRI